MKQYWQKVLELEKNKKQLSIFSSSFYCDCCLFCYKYLVLWRIFLDLKQLHNVILIREAVSYNFSSFHELYTAQSIIN